MSEIQLPSHWLVVKLGKLAERITKGSSPKWQGFFYCNQGVLFVRSQNVGWGYLDSKDIAYLPEAFNHKEKKSILKKDDLLINIVGASIGRAALANKLVEGGNINQAVALVRLKSDCNCDPSFIVNFLLSETGQIQLHRQKKDIARANLSLQDINNLLIAIPPLPEQKTIAHTLRTIQKAKETRQRELELERERKAALMQYLFTHSTRNEPRKQTKI